MKTKDMISGMEIYCSYLNDKSVSNDRDYIVEVDDRSVFIREKNLVAGFPQVWVSKTETNNYMFKMYSDVEYDEYHTQEFIKTLISYSKTPVEEREDEKRWYIHFRDDYLCYPKQDKGTKTYEFHNKHVTGLYKTEFTRLEIEDWAGTSNDEVVDWIIDKFGEEAE